MRPGRIFPPRFSSANLRALCASAVDFLIFNCRGGKTPPVHRASGDQKVIGRRTESWTSGVSRVTPAPTDTFREVDLLMRCE